MLKAQSKREFAQVYKPALQRPVNTCCPVQNHQTGLLYNEMALTAQTQVQARAREKMKASIGQDFESKPTHEKMEMMASMMRTSADNLSKTAGDTKTFYDVLSREQKTIFDLFAKDTWNSRMREHMRHGG